MHSIDPLTAGPQLDDELALLLLTPGGPCSQSTTSCVYLRSVEYYSRLRSKRPPSELERVMAPLLASPGTSPDNRFHQDMNTADCLRTESPGARSVKQCQLRLFAICGVLQ